jgi:hypothetical protein
MIGVLQCPEPRAKGTGTPHGDQVSRLALPSISPRFGQSTCAPHPSGSTREHRSAHDRPPAQEGEVRRQRAKRAKLRVCGAKCTQGTATFEPEQQPVDILRISSPHRL